MYNKKRHTGKYQNWNLFNAVSYMLCLCRKSSSWELSYTISVGGSTVDSRSTASLNTSLLTSNLHVTGPNNVKYRVITNTEAHTYIAASRVSSLYVKSFVSVEDIKKIEEKIAIAWKQQYNSMVKILRKEFHKKIGCEFYNVNFFGTNF